MTNYADLEIGLHRRDVTSYTVDVRFSHTRSDDDKRVIHSSYLPLSRFDTDELRRHQLNPASYGQELSKHLFADEAVRDAFMHAYTFARTQEMPLRVRLFIGPSVPELHRLYWETLQHPETGDPLLTSEHVLFSRYLSSTDWSSVAPGPRTKLRTLIVIANPTNTSDYSPGGISLARVDGDAEAERIQTAIGDGTDITTLLSSECMSTKRPTLNTILSHLDAGYDILYLLAHGAFDVYGEPFLLLEQDDGTASEVSGNDLVARIRTLARFPRLVVLASCSSGEQQMSAQHSSLVASIGPRLAEAGVPAVLAMQGTISMQTIADFMPAFFNALLRDPQRDGQIDHAVTIARRAVHITKRPDWWMPLLFLRLKSGRLWYTPAFAAGGHGRGDEKWRTLLASIRDQKCTPILGPDLTSTFIGSRRAIASRMAEQFFFPLAKHNREDLAHVTQYVATQQSGLFPARELLTLLCQELCTHHAPYLSAELCDFSLKNASWEDMLNHLDRLLDEVWRYETQQNKAEPYNMLASLPFPVYITADPSGLLVKALKQVEKKPRILLSPWNDDTRKPPSTYRLNKGYMPTPDEPLVYHIGGILQFPKSLVLTEDDFFSYLIGVTSNKKLIPSFIGERLTDGALLLLGFHVLDWDFRVFFSELINKQGRERRRHYAHVAVQVTPDEDRTLDPHQARNYLEAYFNSADISMYWGSTHDFMQEFRKRWHD